MGLHASALIINYNGGEDLLRCIESLHSQASLAEILVLDNGSVDGSLEKVGSLHPEVRIVVPEENLGFAGGANAAAHKAVGDVLLFLNPDTELLSGCTESLLEAISHGAGVAGPVLEVEASGHTEYGAVIDWFGYPRPLMKPVPPLYVSGCALATPAKLFSDLGGFDSRYFMFAEDVDYCWRVLLSGHDVVIAGEAKALHRGGASTPGGYGRAGGKKTPSTFRLVMRERNCLAMLIKCLSAPAVFVVPLLYVFQALVTAVGSLVLGNTRAFSGILSGIWWNIMQLPETLRLRRRTRRSSVGRSLLKGRIEPGSNKLKTVVRHGMPRFID